MPAAHLWRPWRHSSLANSTCGCPGSAINGLRRRKMQPAHCAAGIRNRQQQRSWRIAMERRWCSSCGEEFEPIPQSPRQSYCAKGECQKARKLLWQRAKRQIDADHLQNQKEAQRSWRRKNPDYWRSYREAHPDYVAANRNAQRQRNLRRTGSNQTIAKKDVSSAWPPLSGLFRLTEAVSSSPEPPRTWMVRLSLVSLSPE